MKMKKMNNCQKTDPLSLCLSLSLFLCVSVDEAGVPGLHGEGNRARGRGSGRSEFWRRIVECSCGTAKGRRRRSDEEPAEREGEEVMRVRPECTRGQWTSNWFNRSTAAAGEGGGGCVD